MLPLSDRVLLKLSASPKSARQLALALATDVAVVHRVLRVLQAGGAVVEKPIPKESGGWGAAWRLAEGVRVEYRPNQVLLKGATPGPSPTAEGLCRAVTSRGRPCRVKAGPGALCFLHAPRGGSCGP